MIVMLFNRDDPLLRKVWNVCQFFFNKYSLKIGTYLALQLFLDHYQLTSHHPFPGVQPVLSLLNDTFYTCIAYSFFQVISKFFFIFSPRFP